MLFHFPQYVYEPCFLKIPGLVYTSSQCVRGAFSLKTHKLFTHLSYKHCESVVHLYETQTSSHNIYYRFNFGLGFKNVSIIYKETFPVLSGISIKGLRYSLSISTQISFLQ